jgi:hypothetical protein
MAFHFPCLRHRLLPRPAALFVTLLIMGSTPLSAQNLLANADFAPTVGLTGWTAVSISSVYICNLSSYCGGFTPVPVTCCGGSPSNGVQVTATVGANTLYLSQCISDVAPGTDYDFGAWTIRTPDPLTSGVPSVKIFWYSSANCTGSPISGSVLTSTSSLWERLQAGASSPPSAASVEFRLDAGTAGLNFPLAVFTFAAPFFAPAGALPSVPGLSGTGIVLFALALAISGLFVLALRSY